MKYLILIMLFILVIMSCQTHYKTNFDSNGFGIFHYIDTIKSSKHFNISYPK